MVFCHPMKKDLKDTILLKGSEPFIASNTFLSEEYLDGIPGFNY